jgi:hypothetical protein
MQLESARARYRGVRESAPLVSLGHALTSDVCRVMNDQEANDAAYELLAYQLTTVCHTRLSQLLHLRTQLRYRLRKKD